MVGAEPVGVARVPGDELRFEQRKLAHVVEGGGRAGAADFHREEVRAVGRRVAAVLLVAVGAGEVQRVADARAGFEVELLGELGAFELVAPFLHRGAAGARVHAQHVRFVVRHQHEITGQGEGGRCVGRAFGGACVGRELRLRHELVGLGLYHGGRRGRRRVGDRREESAEAAGVTAAAAGSEQDREGAGEQHGAEGDAGRVRKRTHGAWPFFETNRACCYFRMTGP
ncbi:hypothetical protein FQZ97_917950 [compost metagenome]